MAILGFLYASGKPLHLARDHHVTEMSLLLESALFAPRFDAGSSCFTRCRRACMIILLFPHEKSQDGGQNSRNAAHMPNRDI